MVEGGGGDVSGGGIHEEEGDAQPLRRHTNTLNSFRRVQLGRRFDGDTFGCLTTTAANMEGEELMVLPATHQQVSI